MKKWLSAILCMALILPSVGQLPDVQAEELTDGFKSYDISTYREEQDKNADGTYNDYPTIEGYVFAGWYQEDKITPVDSSVTSGTCYAKFVDENVLSVKFQLTAGTTSASEKTNIRLVTTVDTRTYKSVGFEITGKKTITKTTTSVWESLSGYVDEKERVYRPSEFSKDSKFFMSLILPNVSNSSFDLKFTVTPQWTTVDGTTVKGITRSMSVNSHVAAGVILSGDSVGNVYESNPTKDTIQTTEYKVGTGAFISSGAGSDAVRYAIRLNNTIDISAYKDGALQFWLYIGDKSAFSSTTMTIEINSNGQSDYSEINWTYKLSELESKSWNLVKLNFADGTKYSKDSNEIDFTSIKFIRIYLNKQETSEDVKLILDDMRAVAADAPGVILNCDTTLNLSRRSSNVSQTTIENGYQEEATGAFKSTGESNIRYVTELKRAVDISAYKDGALQFWLYVGDITKTTDYDVFGGYQNFAVELSSSGTDTANRIRWSTSFSALNIKANSWNKVTLNFANAAVDPVNLGEMDYGNVNFFRLFMGGATTADALMIVDDIRAVETVADSTTTDSTGLILSGDSYESANQSTYFKTVAKGNSQAVTKTTGEYKVGDGAWKSSGSDVVRYWFAWNSGYEKDLRDYDAIQFWLYVGDTSTLSGNLSVEVSSSGTYDKSEIQWDYAISKLKANSWNLLTLNLYTANAYKNASGGAVTSVDASKIELGSINHFRIYSNSGKSVYLLLDDVRAVKTPEPGVILNCDNMASMSLGGNTNVVTDTEGEYKEGTGAFKATGSGNVLWKAVLDKAVNISSYEDGGIHAWLRVEDVSKLAGDIHVELSSDGATSGYANTHEYEWTISKDKFTDATWTELYLPFEDAVKRDGGADLTAVNWLRVYVPSGVSDEVTVMLDDVRAKVSTKQDILNCDDVNGVTLQFAELTNTATECHGGQGGAFKTTTDSQRRVQATLANPVDISAFKTGKLHFWLYIEEVAKWSGLVGVEISSAGNPDKNALEWRLDPQDLKDGWNEVYLDMGSWSPNHSSEIDYELVNLFRVYQTSNADLQTFTTIVDDIYVVRSTQILACDSASEIVSSSVTVKNTSVEADKMYVQEGTGAFYYSGTNQIIWGSKLTNSIDISDCADGGIHFWFYVNNKDYINGTLNVELTSGGANDKYELQWNIDTSKLQNGWNEISLGFEDALTRDGNIDYSAVNYIRVFQGSANAKGTIITCIDDISAVGYK